MTAYCQGNLRRLRVALFMRLASKVVNIWVNVRFVRQERTRKKSGEAELLVDLRKAAKEVTTLVELLTMVAARRAMGDERVAYELAESNSVRVDGMVRCRSEMRLRTALSVDLLERRVNLTGTHHMR